ncbi:hypothetical protein [Pseudoalteromonas gelatinilytica]|uniref:hypothetical protein n=1 Tax=Pseudoalteromonas gelatinilytica TaxID=1703256 RepID=UPI0012E7695A|nr:hypothetical protein [Pseudoalteromonas gelatinilytica]
MMKKLKIKLIVDLPIDAKHGAIKGAEFEVTSVSVRRQKLHYFIGKTGEECGAFPREFEIIQD